jgi:hypothetical protein
MGKRLPGHHPEMMVEIGLVFRTGTQLFIDKCSRAHWYTSADIRKVIERIPRVAHLCGIFPHDETRCIARKLAIQSNTDIQVHLASPTEGTFQLRRHD